MNPEAPFKILFVCTGNSARSIFGEYLISRFGRGLFRSYSAGAGSVANLEGGKKRLGDGSR